MSAPSLGPLAGTRVLEFRGIGPGPLAGMLLADMGADVVRVDPPTTVNAALPPDRLDLVHRGKRSIVADLKTARGLETVLRLVGTADAVVEGYRPGVAERLGIGPDACLARNPALVYGRMSGWGQDGPYAHAAGHDLNYIALAGVLEGIGRPGDPPTPPQSYVGDYGGGAMFLAFGVVCALLEARRSGTGQVVDAAMVDGAAVLATQYWALKAADRWHDGRGTNFVDGSSPHYDTYECGDGLFVSVAPMEPRFYAELRRLLELTDPVWDDQEDRSLWPQRKKLLAELFRTRTRAEWCDLLEYSDACFAPVLAMTEAPDHPHNRARNTFVEEFGVLQPAPAPRLSATPGAIRSGPPAPGLHSRDVLAEAGFAATEIDELFRGGHVLEGLRV
ncbi:CaiB/BaiF CoA transferase family protein [Pseudonocardia pini]|uniref:CaiB/BaiF CoA transferase family protein n=1 Tax=Pseudonocardia pini TaxID=2758030 RepID=UPI0015EFFF05|nr:CaiB/BaiF CoA-transferase family protein [Pseudonocardia pini]